MRRVKNWALATFILCFLVILAGAVVRTTQSGMGCPDWPKCFGKWIPPTDASQLPPDFEKYLGKQDIDHTFNVYHTWIEYFNRLLGVLLGVFAIVQLLFLAKFRKEEKKAWRLALSFLGLVILTGLFGAVVVKLNLAHLSISVHLLFAIVLVQVQLALLMTLRKEMASVKVDRVFKNLLWFFLTLVFIQGILGTMVRIHIDDISKALNYQQREVWLENYPFEFVLHRVMIWPILFATFDLVRRGNKIVGMKRAVFFMSATIVLTAAAGIILYYANMPAFAQPLHLLLASIAITQVIYLLFKKTVL